MSKSMSRSAKTVMMATLLIGSFITTFSETLMNNALPTIAREMSVAEAQAQWLSTGYMLIAGIMMPAASYFINRIQLRHLFLSIMTIFLVGVLVAAFAPSFPVLLAGRLLQGMAVGISMPLVQNVLTLMFPSNQRGLAMGIAGIVINLGPAVGPTVSGVIVDHYSWRMLFLCLIPLILVGIICGLLFVKDVTHTQPDTLDIPSLLSSMLGFGLMLEGFSRIGMIGRIDQLVGLMLLGSLVTIAFFARRQYQLVKPLLELRVFKSPAFRLSSLLAILTSAAVMAPELILPLYGQSVAKFSPTISGLILIPCAVLTAVCSPISGRIYDRIGIKRIAVIGLTLSVITTIPMIFFNASNNPWLIAGIYGLRGIGITLVYMPVSVYGLNALPKQYLVHGSTVIITLRQLASALGTAATVSATAVGTRIATNVWHQSAQLANQIGYQWAFAATLLITLLCWLFSFCLKNKSSIEIALKN